MKTVFIRSGQIRTRLSIFSLILLTSCAVVPMAPHVTVMPAPGKPFEQFSLEDRECRDYARHAIDGVNTADRTNMRAVGTAALGATVGAAVGSVLGFRHHGIHEGTLQGLFIGSAIGANQSAMATQDMQRRYDIAYQQCMYAKGNQVPSFGYQTVPHVAKPAHTVEPENTAPLFPPPPVAVTPND